MPRRVITPGAIFALTLAVLLVLVLTPTRWSGWVTGFNGPIMTALAPVTWPWAELSRRLRHGPRGVDDLPAELAEKQRQVEFWRAEALASQHRVTQLEATIQALQQGVPLGGRAGYRVLEAARVGSDVTNGTITVRRGSNHAVVAGTVAVPVTSPQHLLGVVTQTGPMVSTVHLINDPRIEPNLIEVVFLADNAASAQQVSAAPRCQLKAERDGTLSGEIGAEAANAIVEGSLAFLSDSHWPRPAQMLIVGRVTLIKPTDDPLWRRIIIRPDLDLARVAGVILRIPADEASSGGAP